MFDFLKRPAVNGANKSGPRSALVTRTVPDNNMTVVYFRVNVTGEKGSMVVSNRFAPVEGETIYYTDTMR
jgi:hypothetical protein